MDLKDNTLVKEASCSDDLKNKNNDVTGTDVN